ncbi:putative sialidase [Chthoniobacter flavus Ellin428]|uniref:Putative sialidase n=1 Tax=Chthoniobacter flavus Ellin428 TaxID=497964 RepID=B4D2Y9_9BACT|nr:hypothetical protein [Chthoniobacter flavus]EDY19100.1 putative sialidase [Chthoniobacter flavus Ellin428]TCO86861.1 hypothetical protein EV701_12678 [Chthoniobacter flavus]
MMGIDFPLARWRRGSLIAAIFFLGICGCERRSTSTATLTPPSTPAPTTQTPAPAPVTPPAPDWAKLTNIDISSAFEPPQEWQDKFGAYRSSLLSYDGTPVTKAEKWPARRAEILQRWQEILGPWPQLDAKPRYTIVETREENGSVEKRIDIDLPPRQTGHAVLTIPKGAQHCGAVLVLSADDEAAGQGVHATADLARGLAERGFITLLIGPPGGNPRKPETEGVECQPLMYLAYVAAVCANVLADQPEVDATKIGVVGHAFAGKWAMFASCFCERFACAVWSEAAIVIDPRKASANYGDPWFLGRFIGTVRAAPRRDDDHPRIGAFAAIYNAGLNLNDLHALMAPRPLLVMAGTKRLPSLAITSADDEGRWTVLNHTIAVNRLLGYDHRVGMLNHASHEMTPEWKAQIARFFTLRLHE